MSGEDQSLFGQAESALEAVRAKVCRKQVIRKLEVLAMDLERTERVFDGARQLIGVLEEMMNESGVPDGADFLERFQWLIDNQRKEQSRILLPI